MYNPESHLKRLVEAHGPSGYEGPIAEILREEWAGLVDEVDGLAVHAAQECEVVAVVEGTVLEVGSGHVRV